MASDEDSPVVVVVSPPKKEENDSRKNEPLSKRQQKRQERRILLQKMQREKKQQRKAERHALALAQGRDLEAERAFVLERTAAGDRQRRVDEVWRVKMEEGERRFRLCLDCGFEASLRHKEIASLAKQIRYCYSYNKNSPNPCLMTCTSLCDGDTTLALLQKETGFDDWRKRAFTCTDAAFNDYYDQNDLSRIVYLTSDASETLHELEDDKIYVVGGIVDRNRLKGTTLQRAEDLGVATAKLPLDDYLARMPTTKVLTCNHVVDILLKYREFGNNWSKALEAVLPTRKEAELRGTG